MLKKIKNSPFIGNFKYILIFQLAFLAYLRGNIDSDFFQQEPALHFPLLEQHLIILKKFPKVKQSVQTGYGLSSCWYFLLRKSTRISRQFEYQS